MLESGLQLPDLAAVLPNCHQRLVAFVRLGLVPKRGYEKAHEVARLTSWADTVYSQVP